VEQPGDSLVVAPTVVAGHRRDGLGRDPRRRPAEGVHRPRDQARQLFGPGLLRYRCSTTRRGALAKTAEDLFAALPPADQVLARDLLLRLIEVGGEGAQDTRRRVGRAELLPEPGAAALIAAGRGNGTIDLWDPLGRQLVTTFAETGTGPMRTLAFSPDERLLATGGWDTAVVMWEVATGRRVGIPLLGHTNFIAFSPDVMASAYQVSVDVRSEGDVLGEAGLAFGIPRRGNVFYVFGLAADGQYELARWVDGDREALLNWADAPVARGKAWNHLGLIWKSDTLTLTINGENVATLNDLDLLPGDVGLFARSFGAGYKARFDNFHMEVLQP
jgi:hypothetical protein